METIEARLKTMLASATPLDSDDIRTDTTLAEMGLGSLRLQIFAVQLESAFNFRFAGDELGHMSTVGDLLAAIGRHTE